VEAFEHASAGGRGSRTSWLCPCACADCKDRQSFPGPSCRRSRIRPLPSRPTAGSGSSLVERCYEVETPFPRSPGGGAGIRLVGLLDVHAAGWWWGAWWWPRRWRWLWRPPRRRPTLSCPPAQSGQLLLCAATALASSLKTFSGLISMGWSAGCAFGVTHASSECEYTEL